MLIALDPGPVSTGFVVCDGGQITRSGCMRNEDIESQVFPLRPDGHTLAIEMIASYGMPVGREVFETCVWIGRFMEQWGAPDRVNLVYRKDVKMHLCGSPRAKDANIRQALIDLYEPTGGGKTPQIGTKAKPGPLYGVSTHAWPALGVAVTVQAKGVRTHWMTGSGR